MSSEDYRFELIHDAVVAEEDDQLTERQQINVDLGRVAGALEACGLHNLGDHLRSIIRRNS